MQTAHTYSSELLAAMTLLTRPDLWHPVPASRPPGLQAHHPLEQCMQPEAGYSQISASTGYFGTGRILGGCWQGQSRKGRRWVFCPRLCVPSPLDATQGPRLPQGRTHPPQTPTSAQRVSEANRGRHGLGAPGSNLSGRSGQEECVFICCVPTAVISASGKTQSSLQVGEASETNRRGDGEHQKESNHPGWVLIGYGTFLERLLGMGHNMRCWQDKRNDALTLTYSCLRPSVSIRRSKVVTR